METLVQYWITIIDTVLDHADTPELRAKLAERVINSTDEFTASQVLDYLYF